jgi:hypothetical protein
MWIPMMAHLSLSRRGVMGGPGWRLFLLFSASRRPSPTSASTALPTVPEASGFGRMSMLPLLISLTTAAELYVMLLPADQLYAPASVPRDGTD